LTLTVLIIGGYGTFGGRLCQLLADEPRLRLLVAGRSLQRAEAFCRRQPAAALMPVAFDRDGDVSAQIERLRPDIIVDASGPFQAYGRDPYRVADAAIANGADYLDFADGRDFVLGIRSRDPSARAAGKFALSGASTCPVLTTAVARALAGGMNRIKEITAGIAPSPHAGIGLGVTRAIASYAGRPISIVKRGAAAIGIGLVDSRVHTVTVPGSIPLRRIRFSLVDVPDLALLPELWPGLQSVWVGAGPTPAASHRSLSLLSRLVSLRLLPSLTWAARAMAWTVEHLTWGEHRGGMFVEVVGETEGRSVRRRWHLIAEGDRGPTIPAVAADVIIRKCLDGRRPAAGARPAYLDVSLAEYERRFAKLGIGTATVDDLPASLPLQRRLLSEAYGRLSPPLHAVHNVQSRSELAGIADVKRGRGLLARLICAVVGFPARGTQVPVTVTMIRNGDGEVWERRFGNAKFQSLQFLGTGDDEGLLVERFGPMSFAMAEVVENGSLRLVQRSWRFLGLRMPRFLRPTGTAREHDADGRFNFEVEIRLPLVGLVVAYRGWLAPVGS
jgi:hypothetical protein